MAFQNFQVEEVKEEEVINGLVAMKIQKKVKEVKAKEEPTIKQCPVTPKSRNCHNCATSSTCHENTIDLTKLQAAEALLSISMGPREANFLIEKWNSQTIKHDMDNSFNREESFLPLRKMSKKKYLTKNKRRFYTTAPQRVLNMTQTTI